MQDDYIAYKRTSEIWNMGHYHFHEQYEILLSLTESAEMFVIDRCYPLRYGSLILLSPSILHRSVADKDQQYNRYVIRFSGHYANALSTNATNLLRSFSSGRAQYQLGKKQTEELSALFEACMKNYTGFGADMKRKIAFINLIIYVEEVTGALRGQPAEAGGFRSNISDILNYIPDHLTEDLSLDALAEKFYISKPHLCRVFKESTGFSPGEYIIKSRIMRARTLLHEGKSVQEAGELSGFRSYAHFIRTFRQLVGVSPGKYKSQETQ